MTTETHKETYKRIGDTPVDRDKRANSFVAFFKRAEAFLLPNGVTVRRGIVESMTVIPLVPNVTYRKVACIFRLSFNIAKENGVRGTCTKTHNYPGRNTPLLNDR